METLTTDDWWRHTQNTASLLQNLKKFQTLRSKIVFMCYLLSIFLCWTHPFNTAKGRTNFTSFNSIEYFRQQVVTFCLWIKLLWSRPSLSVQFSGLVITCSIATQVFFLLCCFSKDLWFVFISFSCIFPASVFLDLISKMYFKTDSIVMLTITFVMAG